MQIKFSITGLKPSLRRRRRASESMPCVPPLVQSIVLAYQMEAAVREGRARDFADVARQTGMTRARVSQIMKLLKLPPSSIESLLLADLAKSRRLTERQARPILRMKDSTHQVEAFVRLLSVTRS